MTKAFYLQALLALSIELALAARSTEHDRNGAFRAGVAAARRALGRALESHTDADLFACIELVKQLDGARAVN